MRPPPSRPFRLRPSLLALVAAVLGLRPAGLAADADGDAALGPIVYRCLGLEPLRLASAPSDERRDASPRLGAAGAWRPVRWPRAPATPKRARDRPHDDPEVLFAEALLLAELREADPSLDGGPPTDTAKGRPLPRSRVGRDAEEVHWFLVATWEASALVAFGGPPAGTPRRRAVAARRAVARPLPPPDLRAQGQGPAPTDRAATPWWIASWSAADLRAPPPHPDPASSGATQAPQPARRLAARGKDARKARPVRDVECAAERAAERPAERAMEAARRGDAPGAARTFSTAATESDPEIDVVLDAAWRAEVDASLGRFTEAATRYERAAMALRASDGPEVAAWVAARVAVLRHRAGLASGAIGSEAVPWPFGALDARGDVVAPRAPPEGPDEARSDPLPTARRATAAWWAARRAAAAGR